MASIVEWIRFTLTRIVSPIDTDAYKSDSRLVEAREGLGGA